MPKGLDPDQDQFSFVFFFGPDQGPKLFVKVDKMSPIANIEYDVQNVKQALKTLVSLLFQCDLGLHCLSGL